MTDSAAVQSHQRALAIRIKLFGEEHESTADSYRQLGVTQNNMHDDSAALQSRQQALANRLKLFGDEHGKISDSYRQVKITQDAQRKWRKVKRAKRKYQKNILKLSDSSCPKKLWEFENIIHRGKDIF